MSEPKPTCHYCGAEKHCVEGDEIAWLRCPKCNATGPTRPTPELCRDAHARVMPVPVFASEVPDQEGYWLMTGAGFTNRYVMRFFDSIDVARRGMLAEYYVGVLFAGPMPLPSLPAEPAEGGVK